MPIKLSAIIITKNEENLIEGCLESIKNLADEIIIFDDLSSDKTVSIAKKYTRKIFKNKLKGFASQKKLGISKAKGKWILILDADERVSGKLAKDIKRVINYRDEESAKENLKVAYSFPRVNYFLGKRMNHGGWQDDVVVRLFRNGFAQYTKQEIHEYLKITGQTGKLQNPVYHFSHRTIADNLLKTRLYATFEAHYHYIRKSPQVTKKLLIKRMIEHFYYRYFKRQGYKDGMEGFIEAVYQTFSYIFIIQSMLWEKQRGKSAKQLYTDLDRKLQIKKFNFD